MEVVMIIILLAAQTVQAKIFFTSACKVSIDDDSKEHTPNDGQQQF